MFREGEGEPLPAHPRAASVGAQAGRQYLLLLHPVVEFAGVALGFDRHTADADQPRSGLGLLDHRESPHRRLVKCRENRDVGFLLEGENHDLLIFE